MHWGAALRPPDFRKKLKQNKNVAKPDHIIKGRVKCLIVRYRERMFPNINRDTKKIITQIKVDKKWARVSERARESLSSENITKAIIFDKTWAKNEWINVITFNQKLLEAWVNGFYDLILCCSFSPYQSRSSVYQAKKKAFEASKIDYAQIKV